MASDEDEDYDAVFGGLTPEQLQGLAALDAMISMDRYAHQRFICFCHSQVC